MYILTLTAQQDVIFAISPLIIWAATEMWLIIIMGSIPPLRTLLVRFFRRVGETISHSIHTSKHSQSNSVQLSRIRNNGKHHERDTSSQERMTNYEGEYIVMSKSADGVPERGYDNRAIHVTTQVEIKHVNDVEKGFDEGLGRLRMPEHRL
ncbi:MAG: hypothetical protein M1822_007606 [Bathelium mastoideum]|nr:MAG: hypothetical protein M1822_007606 [Bathelium mastoideum]